MVILALAAMASAEWKMNPFTGKLDYYEPGGITGPAGPPGFTTFSAVTSGTNTLASLVVGTGASISAAGSGTISATSVPLAGVSGAGTSASHAATDFATASANTGTNTGDETAATIKSKLSISTLSGSNTGDETLASIISKLTFTPENVISKSTDSNLGSSDTLYPSQKAVKGYVDAHGGSGSMTYPSAGFSVSTGTSWATSLTGTECFPILDSAGTPSCVSSWVYTDPTFSGTITTAITGTIQCLYADASGVMHGSNSACGTSGGSGTVTSVGIAGVGMTVSGSPVTSNSTITLTISAVNLSSGVTSSLPLASLASGTLTQNTSGSAASLSATLAIASGGTGTISLPSGILKGAGTGSITAASAGSDYLAPSGSGAALTGITYSQVTATPVFSGQYGGTGVANTGKTITLGGDLVTNGAFTTVLVSSAGTTVTLPTSGILLSTSTGSTGSGNLVYSTSPTLTTPAIYGGVGMVHLASPASGTDTFDVSYDYALITPSNSYTQAFSNSTAAGFVKYTTLSIRPSGATTVTWSGVTWIGTAGKTALTSGQKYEYAIRATNGLVEITIVSEGT